MIQFFYVIVKAPCECITPLLNEVCNQENDNAQGVAECVISSQDRKLSSIMPVVYDCEQCSNWFVYSKI